MFLAVRSRERGDDAARSIAETTGRTDVVEAWELDLASYASTVAFAGRAEAALERLDNVVGNAGMHTHVFGLAEDCERTVTVNFVGTMLLAVLLLPKLRETAVRLDTDVVLTFTGSFVRWLTSFPERGAEDILQELAREDVARMMDRQVVCLAGVYMCVMCAYLDAVRQVQCLQADATAGLPRVGREANTASKLALYHHLNHQPWCCRHRHNATGERLLLPLCQSHASDTHEDSRGGSSNAAEVVERADGQVGEHLTRYRKKHLSIACQY